MARTKKSKKAKVVENQQVTRWLKAVLEDESFVDVGILANPDTGDIKADDIKTQTVIENGSKKVEPSFDGTTLIEIAVKHEFGLDGLPQRSFIRSTYEENKANTTKIFTRLIKREVRQGKNTKPDVDKILSLVGNFFVGKVKRKFTNNNWEPNSVWTVLAKGSSRPLIDTGQLRASITFNVNRIFVPLKEVKQV